MQCVGLTEILNGTTGLAIWGDDSFTSELDGLPPEPVPDFAVLYNDQIIFVEEIPEFSGFVINGVENITEVILTTELPYIVAVNENNLVVGSVEVSNGVQVWSSNIFR